MMSRKVFFFGFVLYCVFATSPTLLQASYIYSLEIFSNNGGDNDNPDLDFFVEVTEVTNGEVNVVDFTFHNESFYDDIPIESSIARIYFDDDSLLHIADITDGPGTTFSQSARPKNLPSGKTLEPPFLTTEEFSFNSEAPRPHNGINPGEWVRITFDISGGTFEELIGKLNTGAIRIGTHIIAFSDGSSESAVTIPEVPEPATIVLLGLGGLVLIRRHKK